MVEDSKKLAGSLYRHHFVRYLFVGGTTFGLDIGLLLFLHQKLGLWVPVATTISYWIAVVYNFNLNRKWTFSVSEKETLRKHLAPYLILLGFNYLFTVVSVSILSHHMYVGRAKVISVAVQMTWTYLIYKNVIFVKNAPKLTDSK